MHMSVCVCVWIHTSLNMCNGVSSSFLFRLLSLSLSLSLSRPPSLSHSLTEYVERCFLVFSLSLSLTNSLTLALFLSLSLSTALPPSSLSH